MQSFHPPHFPLHRKRRLGLILILTLTALGLANQSKAEGTTSEPWFLEADRITYHNNPQQVVAEGEVVLRHKEETTDTPLEIKADTATYRAAGSVIDARGNVFMKEERGTISAASILLNLQDQTGKLTAADISMTDQEIKFSGEIAEKVSENQYILYDGMATSCQPVGNKSPAWSVNWKKADITIDGMAFLEHATFRVKEVPLFYMPYMILPAKITRQTGFLLPEISHSNRDGTGWTTPFFINLAPSSDLTLYPGYHMKRGTFAGLEMRHVNDYNSKVTLSINYQEDRTQDQGPPGSTITGDDYRKDGYLRTEHNRYWIRGKADQYFSASSVLRLDLDVVSDQDFLHEYRDGIAGFTRNNTDYGHDFNRGLQEASLTARESILQYASRGKLSSGGLEVRYVDDALADFSTTKPAQTLPRILFSSRLPLGDLPLSFDWDSEYVHYRPAEGIGYQRVDLFPKLVMPIPFGPLIEGTVIGGFRETAYQVETLGNPATGWTYSNTQNRNTWDLSTNIAAVLARDFSTGPGSKLTHTFRPNLRYNFRDSDSQNELPNLDNADYLGDGNSLTIELNNYFRSSKVDREFLPAQQVGYLKLTQSYNLEEARRNLSVAGDKRRPFSDLGLDLEISPLTNLFLRYQTALNHYSNDGPVSRYNLQGRYTNARKDNLTIDYDYVKGAVRNLIMSSLFNISDSFSISYSTTRSLLDNHATSESAGLIYKAQCWGVELTSIKDSEDRRVMVIFSLAGIGDTLEWGKNNI